MAHLQIDEHSLVIVLSPKERIQAFHGNVSVPRSAVADVRVVPDGMHEVHGIRAPGTALPGVTKVGTWRSAGATTFAACHGHAPAVVIDLTGESYDRLVVTVQDPEAVQRSLRSP